MKGKGDKMTWEARYIEKFGDNKFYARLLEIYKRCYSYLWGIKKEMPFGTRIYFSCVNKFPERGS